MAKNDTTAIIINTPVTPTRAGLTWCFAGVVVATVLLVVTPALLLIFTVVKGVADSGTPLSLLSRDAAVPVCTPLELAADAEGLPAVCGLWVLVWVPELVPVVNKLLSITTIVKQLWQFSDLKVD